MPAMQYRRTLAGGAAKMVVRGCTWKHQHRCNTLPLMPGKGKSPKRRSQASPLRRLGLINLYLCLVSGKLKIALPLAVLNSREGERSRR